MAEQWGAAESAADQGYGACAYETRFPFLHRPLVEALLRMPWDVKVHPYWNKFLLRKIGNTLLPDGFAWKASKAADQAVNQALAAQNARLRACVTPCALARRGLVDEASLHETLSLAQHGFVRGLRHTVVVIAVELWTRSVESGDWLRQQQNRFATDPCLSASHPL